MTPLNEKIMNSVEAILDNLYPKAEFEGDYITAENTVKGLYGKVTAEEETEITVCNKNLCSLGEDKSATNNGITVTIQNGEISIEGSATKATDFFPNLGSLTNFIDAGWYKAGTYVISLITDNAPSISSPSFAFYIRDKNRSQLYSFSNTLNFKKVITLEKDMYLYFQLYGNATNVGIEWNTTIQIQIEEGDTATDYVEHKEQVYTGTSAEFKTYDEKTHIYNTDGINMIAKIRTKGE